MTLDIVIAWHTWYL